mmetsp:Transcript_32657/g.92621  ORF Transcript_32657/g.92621 Transcript_32657/m.92621 type:complete len:131 (-) Transcript_32657:2925-3317(-)
MELLCRALKFIFSLALLAYVSGVLFLSYTFIHVDRCPDESDRSLDCLWPKMPGSDPNVDLAVFVSKGPRRLLPALVKENNLVYKAENIRSPPPPFHHLSALHTHHDNPNPIPDGMKIPLTFQGVLIAVSL